VTGGGSIRFISLRNFVFWTLFLIPLFLINICW
jgi:hypothetical protein